MAFGFKQAWLCCDTCSGLDPLIVFGEIEKLFSVRNAKYHFAHCVVQVLMVFTS